MIIEDNQDRAKIIKSIKESESIKRMYKKFARHLKPVEREGLNYIDILDWDKVTMAIIICLVLFFKGHPLLWEFAICMMAILQKATARQNITQPAVDYKRVALKEDMEKALFKHHIQYFIQANATPFTQNPLEYFGLYAETEMRETFSNGTLTINALNVDRYTKQFLKELQRKEDDPPEISTEFTPKDIKANYKNGRKVHLCYHKVTI